MKCKRRLCKVLKEVTCNLQNVFSKRVKNIKKVLKLLKSVRKSSQQKFPTMQKRANQLTVLINWLVAAQRQPKTRRDFRAEQSINNVCDFII